jgi:hypothetical protein
MAFLFYIALLYVAQTKVETKYYVLNENNNLFNWTF